MQMYQKTKYNKPSVKNRAVNDKYSVINFIGPWDWLSQFFWHLIAKMIYIRCEDIHLNMKYKL